MPSPFEWSDDMDSVFWNCVARPVFEDPRTDWSENRSLGYPFEVIRECVLTKGLADFGQPHDDPQFGSLTADEKALLYCFVNMKKHFFACQATFEIHQAAIADLVASEESLVVLDVGCGPATACLALCDLIPGRRINYIGIDSASSMRERGRILWEAAMERGLAAKGSVAEFKGSWTDLALEQLPAKAPVLIVFSYFFASRSLTLGALQSLASLVMRVAKSRTGKPVLAVYTNSTNELANRNFELFKQHLGLDPEKYQPIQLTIEFRKKRGGVISGKEHFLQQLLQLG